MCPFLVFKSVTLSIIFFGDRDAENQSVWTLKTFFTVKLLEVYGKSCEWSNTLVPDISITNNNELNR